jgi:hypothetical protein
VSENGLQSRICLTQDKSLLADEAAQRVYEPENLSSLNLRLRSLTRNRMCKSVPIVSESVTTDSPPPCSRIEDRKNLLAEEKGGASELVSSMVGIGGEQHTVWAYYQLLYGEPE